MATGKERIRNFIKRPETRKWLADKAGGAVVGNIIIIAAIAVIDHVSDGNLELIGALVSMFTE